MLGSAGMLDLIDLKVDYLMSGSSYAEHGANLIWVNHYELCAQKAFGVPSTEWWPYVECMFSIQDCLNFNTTAEAKAANQTSAGSASGADDTLTIQGAEADVDCNCTISGVAEYCAVKHTSIDFVDLQECAYGPTGHALGSASAAVAEAANSGYPLWIMVNNITIFDNWKSERKAIDTWATAVKSAACDHITLGTGYTPDVCL